MPQYAHLCLLYLIRGWLLIVIILLRLYARNTPQMFNLEATRIAGSALVAFAVHANMPKCAQGAFSFIGCQVA